MDDRVGYTNFWPDEDDVVRRAQFCAAVLAVTLSLAFQSPWLRIGSLFAMNGVIALIVLQAFDRLSLYVPCLAPAAQLNLTVLFGFVCDFV